MECTFLGFEVEVMIKRDLKDISDCSSMSVYIGMRCDANVVHVYPYRGASEFVFENGILEDVVHHGLKCCRRVSESEVHDCGFEESVLCFKCCFSFVSFFDTYVVVSPPNIQLRVYMRIAEVSYKV